MNVLPWQEPQWESLLAGRRKLPHALLLAGPAGIGKVFFARALAAALLCENPADDGGPCNGCSSCNWLAAGSHPDFRLLATDAGEEREDSDEVGPGKPRSSIGIDRIRALEDFVFLGSHRHGNRVALIAGCEMMTLAAANALLKILEEPPPSVYFVLVSNEPRRLLSTVLSRCRKIAFSRPQHSLALAWLQERRIAGAAELLELAGGAPLLAADWAEEGVLPAYRAALATLAEEVQDPVAMAARWAALLKGPNGLALAEIVNLTQKWLLDLCLLKFAGAVRYHGRWQKELSRLAERAPAAGLLACYNDLLRLKAVARHPLNAQLYLEDMAARYQKALAMRL